MEEGGLRAAVKTVLDKPLHQLTEDDISQLTREDCRRYLKDKGMRRPSWNKSQAIQQVISLKSLLEPSPPNNKPPIKPYLRPPPLPIPIPAPAPLNNLPVNSSSSSSAKELSSAEVEGSVSAFGEDGCPNQPEGTSSPVLGREGVCHADDIQGSPDRCDNGSSIQFDQMPSFYSDKVNVYNGVPVDKQAGPITHLSASPIQFHQDEPSCDSLPNLNAPYQLHTSSVKLNKATPDALTMQSMIIDAEGQTNRQVSLQRYLEKRKDRGKFKMKSKTGTSSSALELYLSDQMKAPAIFRQDSGSNTSATSQLGEDGAPHTFSEAMGKHPKNLGLSIDLNDKV